MAELDILLLKCRGLSTRHLQEYLDLFRFRKILKYTVEYLKQKKKCTITHYYKILVLKTKIYVKEKCQLMLVKIMVCYSNNSSALLFIRDKYFIIIIIFMNNNIDLSTFVCYILNRKKKN